MFQVPYPARQQYLAAQAEARAAQARAEAAKAEYLAQEALLQEEIALKARLYEIEQRKRYASLTSFAPNPYTSADAQYGWSQQSFDAPYSFSPSGLSLPIRQALPPVDFLELEYQQAQVQALERLRKEGEQDRLRKQYEAQLTAEAELERKRQAIQAAEANYHYYPCGALPAAQRQGTKAFCSIPTLKGHPVETAKAQAFEPPKQAYTFMDLDEKRVKDILSSFGFGFAPTTAAKPANKPQSAPKVPPQPSSAPVASGNVAQPKSQAAHASTPQRSGESPVDQLKTHCKVDNAKEVKDTIFAVIGSLAAAAPAAVKQAPKVAPKKPTVDASLVEQLQARSQSEQDRELRDTIQATLNSLLPEFNTRPSPQASASASHSRSSSKAKQPGTPSVESRLEEVHRIEEEFRKFESEFIFPSELDFVASPNSSSTALAHLAFTARNHPVRFYEQALGSLLAELDSIESQGDATLRSKRKEAVKLVEQALERLEEQIMGRWNATKAKEDIAVEADHSAAPASFTVPVSNSNESKVEKVDVQDNAASTPAEGPASIEANVDTAIESVLEENQIVDSTSSSDSEAKPEEDATLSSITEAEAEAGPVAESSPDFSLEELEKFESTSPSESQLTIKPEDTTTLAPTSKEQSTSDNVDTVANPEESETSDGFLLAQTEEARPKHKSKESQVEDLGSDWSDLDA